MINADITGSCREGDFKCRTSGKCVSQLAVCDNVVDCPDHSDEEYCRGLYTVYI